MKRSIILSKPCHLSIKDSQLVIELKPDKQVHTRHLEDFGLIILEHPQITLTHGVLQALAQNNVILVSCDAKHMPASMSWPMDVHHTHGQRAKAQLESPLPVRKQLWKQTVTAKILNQAKVLDILKLESRPLVRWAAEVKSGDSTNREGLAAKHYFSQLFGKGWIRDPDGQAPNPMLNYAYTILRAAMARAIVGAGLLPILGIHHHNKYNSYPLADDLMEPYRPFADLLVKDFVDQGLETSILNPEIKRHIFTLLESDTNYNGTRSPLQVSMENVCANAARCFNGETKRIDYPTLPDVTQSSI